jgi:hypothetical protein
MGFWEKLFGKKKEKPKLEDKPKIYYEDIPNTLDLGWYYSENKNEWQMAKIREEDRRTHMYVIGATGVGKTKFLEFLIRQDIEKRNGFGVIDPHGDLIEDIKDYLILNLSPFELEEKVILIDPTDEEKTVAFNPLEKVEGISSSEISAELVEVFKKIWIDSWGARMEDLLRNTFISLIEAELTLDTLPQFLTDENFRNDALLKVSHPIAKNYFKRFNSLSAKTREEWIESTLNKVNAFLSDDRIREIFSFKKSSFNLREIMDNKKILLLKIDKGKLKENGDLFGSLFLTKIKLSAFSRSNIKKEERIPFYLYIDEFQNFATKEFIETLSEARKYGLYLILAHQNLSQLPKELQDSILTNCGIQCYFRVCRRDAEILAKEAFEVTGLEPKFVSYKGDGFDFKFFSYQEEWERYIKELENLQNRCFFAKHKIEGGILPLFTPEILPAYEEFKIEKEVFEKIKENVVIGKRYLLERKRETEEIKAEDEKKINLEKIVKDLTPLEKAILFAIGTGNYLLTEIYEKTNEKLKEWGYSKRKYEEIKEKLYEFSKLPKDGGKGLIEFMKVGKTFYYWLSKWGEIAFSEKFGIPSDRAINELSNKEKESKEIILEVVKEWLEPQGYKVKFEQEIETDLTESHRGYTDLVAKKDGEILRIEIEHRSPKEQIEKNIKKNLKYSDTLFIITSDEASKRKVIQVALKILFRMKKEKSNAKLKVKIASIDELKKSQFKDWFEVRS